jgi:MFS transporter, DHA2 family, glioxin efflux transporter
MENPPAKSENTLVADSALQLPVTEKEEVRSGTATPGSRSGGSIQDEVDKEKLDNEIRRVATNEQYVTGAKLIPVILALVLAVFLIALDMTIVGTAIPKITDEFHGLSQVPWVRRLNLFRPHVLTISQC